MPNAFGYKIAVPFDECVFYSVNNQINPAFKHYAPLTFMNTTCSVENIITSVVCITCSVINNTIPIYSMGTMSIAQQ